MGQIWLYNSETCSSTAHSLWAYSIALVSMVYISLLLPLILILMICICLPCLLIVLRVVGDGRGASSDAIDRLPTRKWNSSDEQQSPSEDKPSCSICMYEYEVDQEVRTLPCEHEFHATCIDRWLRIKRECPLCRADITQSNRV